MHKFIIFNVTLVILLRLINYDADYSHLFVRNLDIGANLTY